MQIELIKTIDLCLLYTIASFTPMHDAALERSVKAPLIFY